MGCGARSALLAVGDEASSIIQSIQFQDILTLYTMKNFGIVAVALFFVQCLADGNDPVTCGSTIKLLHDPSVSES